MPTYSILCGSDVAAFGIWDIAEIPGEAKSWPPSAALEQLDADARSGKLFYVSTGGDGSYPTKIFVNQHPEPGELEHFDCIGRDFGLLVRSGRVVVGGLEDYSSQKRQITSDHDEIPLEVGWYSVRCYERKYTGEETDDEATPARILSLREQRIYNIPYFFILTLAILFVATIMSIGKMSALITFTLASSVVVVYAVFRKFLRSRHYNEVVHRVQSKEVERPDYILELWFRGEQELEGGFAQSNF